MFDKLPAMLLSALVASALPAQEKEDVLCPHQKVVQRDRQFTILSQVVCGNNGQVTIGGVTWQSRPFMCPLLAEYIAPHAITQYEAGCNTYTEPSERYQITLFTFACKTHWLFGIIPIEVGSSCEFQESRVVHNGVSYVQHACRD